jgi:hypothetical protein
MKPHERAKKMATRERDARSMRIKARLVPSCPHCKSVRQATHVVQVARELVQDA